MKHLLFFLLLLPVAGQSQTLYEPFEIRMVDTSSGSKKELYNRVRTWVNKFYHTNKEVIVSEDLDSGRIVGKGSMMYPTRNLIGMTVCDAAISYIITIEVKNGRYRGILSDFRHNGCFNGKEDTPTGGLLVNDKPAGHLSKRQWASIKAEAAENGIAVLRSLSQFMRNEAEKHADW